MKTPNQENTFAIPEDWKTYLLNPLTDGMDKIDVIDYFLIEIADPDFRLEEIQRFIGYLTAPTLDPEWFSQYRHNLNGIFRVGDLNIVSVGNNNKDLQSSIDKAILELGNVSALIYNRYKVPFKHLERLLKYKENGDILKIPVNLNAAEFAYLIGHLLKLDWIVKTETLSYKTIADNILKIFDVKTVFGSDTSPVYFRNQIEISLKDQNKKTSGYFRDALKELPTFETLRSSKNPKTQK